MYYATNLSTFSQLSKCYFIFFNLLSLAANKKFLKNVFIYNTFCNFAVCYINKM